MLNIGEIIGEETKSNKILQIFVEQPCLRQAGLRIVLLKIFSQGLTSSQALTGLQSKKLIFYRPIG